MKIRITKVDDLVFLAPLFCFGFAWLIGNFEWMERFEWRTGADAYVFAIEKGGLFATLMGPGSRRRRAANNWPMP